MPPVCRDQRVASERMPLAVLAGLLTDDDGAVGGVLEPASRPAQASPAVTLSRRPITAGVRGPEIAVPLAIGVVEIPVRPRNDRLAVEIVRGVPKNRTTTPSAGLDWLPCPACRNVVA